PNANYFLHSGLGMQGRPSMGAWATYGLGTGCRNLPGFVVLNSGMIPPGGLDCFTSGFLPASYQGSLFRNGDNPVADLKPAEAAAKRQQNQFTLMRELDRSVVERMGAGDKLESAIANYELAYRMQTAVPELMDTRSETPATQEMYGLNDASTRIYGQQ